MIDRRAFARGSALLALLPGVRGPAQGSPRLPRIARISLAPAADLAGPDPADRAARAFVHGLRELGWVDGRTATLDQRSADGQPERLPALLREVVALQPDVIVTAGQVMTRYAHLATETLPIVAIGPDLLAMGLASSLARPGGNVTGLTFQIGAALSAKRLELLKRAVPAARRVAVLRPSPAKGQTLLPADVAAAARQLGLTLWPAFVDSATGLDAALAAIVRERPDALWCTDSPVNINERHRIAAFASRERLPSIAGQRQVAEAGALMTYGTNLADAERRAATYVDKILKGARPGELPIEQPTRFELVINLKTAAALGLKLPQDLLLAADEVLA